MPFPLTLTTDALDVSSSGWFGNTAWSAYPRGLPSSQIQHGWHVPHAQPSGHTSNKLDRHRGEVHDSTEAQALIDGLPAGDALVADKGYDSERIREQVEAKGMAAVIPRRRNSKKGNANLDRGLYRYRHLVENAFARLKPYRAIATRYDKLKRNYESMVALACGFLWLPM
ncbi:IS5 family transposase [Halomonas piscis]|uniref:IS5 family transposase n=1 Tax=Halomonas piscis TaxID=3031727 RepID=UPI0028A08AE9|nr:IS5 family transposase [Halomonas piscis]